MYIRNIPHFSPMVSDYDEKDHILELERTY